MSQNFKSVFRFTLTAILALAAILIINTVLKRQRRFPWEDVHQKEDNWLIDKERSMLRAERLAKSLTIPTISWEPGRQELHELLKFHSFLKESKYNLTFLFKTSLTPSVECRIIGIVLIKLWTGFPLIHSSPSIERTVINEYSLLYKVTGTLPNVSLPYMLAAHMDVVPVDGNWVHEPFGGQIIDNIIYGRGAIDDKNSVMVRNLILDYRHRTGHCPFCFRVSWKLLNSYWNTTMNSREHFILRWDMMKR